MPSSSVSTRSATSPSPRRHAALAGAGPARRRRRSRAGRSGRPRRVRRRRTSSAGLRDLGARSRAGGHCRPDEAHPARIGGDRAQHRRSGARLPALLDAERDFQRPRRSDSRPRLVHRVVSAVRLRPVATTRSCSRTSWRSSPSCSGRAASRGADRPRRRSAGTPVYPPIEHGTLRDVGRRRRQSRIGRARGALRPAADARDHRRQPDALQAVRRPLSPGAREAAEGRMLPIAVHSPGHVAATDEQAKNELWPHYETMINRIGGERGWPPASRAQFEREAGPDGALCVGSPETVAAKIAAHREAARPVAVQHEIQRRHAAARQADDEHRADRPGSRAARSRRLPCQPVSRLRRASPPARASRITHHASLDGAALSQQRDRSPLGRAAESQRVSQRRALDDLTRPLVVARQLDPKSEVAPRSISNAVTAKPPSSNCVTA